MAECDSTVFVIDDDEGIRFSLARALGKRGFVVETFASATAFLEVFDASQTGCIVLDHGMPDMTGLELQAKLVADGFTVPIIFITGHGGVPESVQAMKAGAIDFLEKPFRTEALVERIKEAIKTNASKSAQREKALEAKAKLDMLTSREMEIVALIVSDPSNTTSKEIARVLDISPRTVDHHRARILEKLQIKSIVELIDLTISSNSVTR
ncbi:response regulator transcription factor [Yoonia sediminilitoris]|uniref:LuxR family two component transcriptional regulator n=1 Tax=Yoonia sediminilitoris TaxID=1286148 RepID=A0A2T6K8G6_9RHOB|nr:response regulator [Yoonia sediminilitoris]PUB11034.1 LuxR family two component transcriptional regulator [Yoonia sediminilitoris]RCW90953.1 LuxR family two component transcriptional regulator [Yoonia sediminilitoris]